jgi:hypothetical protein
MRLSRARWPLVLVVPVALFLYFGLSRARRSSHPARTPPALSPADASTFSDTTTSLPDVTTGPLPAARAFALAEWTSTGAGGLHALAARTAPWATARLHAEWANAPDPPAGAPAAATAQILDASIVDPRAAQVVVQVDVQRWWTGAGTPVVDPVPHVLLLIMVGQGDSWRVDDVAAVS